MYYVEHQSLPLLDVEEGFYIFQFELRFHKSLQFTHCELLLCGFHVAGGKSLPGDNRFDPW